MSLRCLSIPALLILACPVFAQSQSLGDIARQVRSERQQSGATHSKVYTNDDVASPTSPAVAEKSTKAADAAKPAESSTEASSEAGNKPADSKDAATAVPNSAAADRQAREAELQKRTDEINQQYLDKIAGIRTQIGAAQQELARLQRDQAESASQFRTTVGSSPSIPEYEQQQRLFAEQIEAQRNLSVSLKSQLEDAQESARHAGVPHATD
jgi:hypothetical protein